MSIVVISIITGDVDLEEKNGFVDDQKRSTQIEISTSETEDPNSRRNIRQQESNGEIIRIITGQGMREREQQQN